MFNASKTMGYIFKELSRLNSIRDRTYKRELLIERYRPEGNRDNNSFDSIELPIVRRFFS